MLAAIGPRSDRLALKAGVRDQARLNGAQWQVGKHDRGRPAKSTPASVVRLPEFREGKHGGTVLAVDGIVVRRLRACPAHGHASVRANAGSTGLKGMTGSTKRLRN